MGTILAGNPIHSQGWHGGTDVVTWLTSTAVVFRYLRRLVPQKGERGLRPDREVVQDKLSLILLPFRVRPFEIPTASITSALRRGSLSTPDDDGDGKPRAFAAREVLVPWLRTRWTV